MFQRIAQCAKTSTKTGQIKTVWLHRLHFFSFSYLILYIAEKLIIVNIHATVGAATKVQVLPGPWENHELQKSGTFCNRVSSVNARIEPPLWAGEIRQCKKNDKLTLRALLIIQSKICKNLFYVTLGFGDDDK